MVGDFGIILTCANGGFSWNRQSQGTLYNLHSVTFTDANTGYAVSEGNDVNINSAILKTINGGVTWSIQNSGTLKKLFSVCFPSPEVGYIAGKEGDFENHQWRYKLGITEFGELFFY